MPDSPPIAELEACIGYTFADRSLLEMALTLPSYRMDTQGVCPDNQRLEFLGDAVLGLVAAQLLYETYPDLGEGPLTTLRSQMASGRSLANIAREIQLGAYFRVGRGEERQFGRDREGALADGLEALFGAIWLDGGLSAVRDVVLCLIGIPAPDTLDEDEDNPKGGLQEYVQQHRLPMPDYAVVHVGGPTHAPWYRVRVRCANIESEAEGRSKRLAERLAASQLLELLLAQPLLPDSPPPDGK